MTIRLDDREHEHSPYRDPEEYDRILERNRESLKRHREREQEREREQKRKA